MSGVGGEHADPYWGRRVQVQVLLASTKKKIS